jgi:AraC family transcriptional regulator
MTATTPSGPGPAAPQHARCGLAGWQLRRAVVLMHGDACLKQVAAECGLSRSHFSKAFKERTGQSPHQWRIQGRIERAKAFLSGSTLSLAAIAVECGFADQSHLTRAFSKTVGLAPGVWRRTRV